MPGCPLLVSPDAVVPVLTQGVPSRGNAQLRFVIPALPSLTGQVLFAQWVVLDGAPPGPAGSVTRGLQITIQ